MRSYPTSFAIRIAAFLASSAALFAAGNASAQRAILDPMGDKGTLVFDQVSGFRASTIGGIGYAGPIGFSTQTLGSDLSLPNGQNAGSVSQHFTSFWIAPSADYFIIDHLSLGGLLEFSTTSRTDTTTLIVGTTQTTTSTSAPTVNNFTILPRIGYLFGITDRFGIWPRLGLGYASRQSSSTLPNANAGSTDTFGAFVMDLDVGFLYRVNEVWFLRGAPELTFAPGSVSHTTVAGGTTVDTSTNGHFFQFAVVGGIGVMWDLR